jgi:hypothetical protein
VAKTGAGDIRYLRFRFRTGLPCDKDTVERPGKGERLPVARPVAVESESDRFARPRSQYDPFLPVVPEMSGLSTCRRSPVANGQWRC